MDLDNFEFRPLTKGLGFDKSTQEKESRTPVRRAISAPPAPEVHRPQFEMPEKDFATPPNDTPVSRSLKKMLDSLPPSVDFAEDKERELKLHRPQMPDTPFAPPSFQTQVAPAATISQGFDITLDNSLSQAFPKEEVSKRFYHQLVTPIPQYKEITTSFASAFIDMMIVLGLASLFVVTLVAITQVDLVRMLTSSELSQRMLIELGLLYFGVTLFYFMLSRGLFGSTLGDWAFDVQLGSAEQRRHLGYPLQVIFRTFMIIVTGIVIVPLLSLIFAKDMGYYFSGLKLYSRQY
jgi:hypothetical protein